MPVIEVFDAFTAIDGPAMWVHAAWVAGLAVVGVAAAWLVVRRPGDER